MVDTVQLQRLAKYREQRSDWFPSDGSLTWYVRHHRPELVERGALVLHAGAWHAVPPAFDAAVLDIGQRTAQRRIKA